MLAGGRGSRLGGIEKGEIEVDGERLIDIVVRAALEVGCEPVVVAGETRAGMAVNVIEESRFGGPVAGLAAALPSVRTDWFMLLACDLPHASGLCGLISRSALEIDTQADGIVVTANGHRQWLAGWYRTGSVKSALKRLGDPAGASLRQLLGGLDLAEAVDTGGWSQDIDTPEDLDTFTRKEHR